MKVAEALESIGSRVTSFFGDSRGETPPNSYDTNTSRDSVFGDKPISDILPFEAYDPRTKLFYNKDSIGFVIELMPLVGGDDSVQKEVLSLFQEVMREGSSIQCLLWGDHRVSSFLGRWSQARESEDPVYVEMARRRAEYLKSAVPTRLYRCIFSYSEVLDQGTSKVQVDRVEGLLETMTKTVQGLTQASVWDADDFMQAMDGLINFRLEPDGSDRRWRQMESLSSQLPTGGGLCVESDHLRWWTSTETVFRSYRAVDYPDAWTLLNMQNLIGDLYRDSYRINVPFVIHYGVHCPHQEKAEASFKRRMHLIENQGKSSALIRMIPELGEELMECEYVRRSHKQGNRFVYSQLGVGVWCEERQLHHADQVIKSLFRINEFTLAENRYLHLPQFLSFLPMTWSEYVDDLRSLNLLKSTLSSECSNLVPLQGEWMGTQSPGVMLVGRRGQLLNWNPFDNSNGNYNVVVTGRSGSGKSVFMQELLVSSLGVGGRVFVLDVGRSFEKTCEIIGGQHIEFGGHVPICLNPFTHIPSSGSDERDQSFAMLKSVIATMAAPDDGTSDFENALIEKAIRHAWESKGNEATVTDVSEWLQNQGDDRATTLGVMLTPYTAKGVYAKYFEGTNNVDFERPFVLIELEELKEKKDLQSVVLQMFIMTITAQAFLGDRRQPFHICIDEAWDLLRGKNTGEFIETLARRLRKYNGSLVVGTQSMDDFYSTPGATAAFENSDWMCMLSQKQSSIQRFFDSGKGQISEGQRVAMESVTTKHGEYSEVMIYDAEGNYSIGRLILDPFSKLLYSTKAEEYTRIKDAQKLGLSMTEAITHVLEGGE